MSDFLRPVMPDQIPQVWGFVEPGLGEIIQRYHDCPWTARDVRRALRRADAALFVNDHGFVVIQRAEEAISREPLMHVWLMWFSPMHAAQNRGALIEWLDSQCRAMMCEWWEFGSTRGGWGRALEEVCEPAVITWRRVPRHVE